MTTPVPPVPVLAAAEVFRALASPKRLQILEWLRDPVANFPPQRDGDLVDDGVCVIFIADKLGVTQPTATAHLQALARARLVTSKRVGRGTFYKRDEAALGAFKRQLRDEL
ncbi:MAG: ArsR/SmtB family transcription factor [Streptosporangiaceae bacterium]